MNQNQTTPASQLAPIVRRENVEIIASQAPDSYDQNSLSALRCLQAGEQLLADAQHGLDDNLDRRIASYISKTRNTLKAMNERRAPVTKLFDQIRKAYTELENSIDPAKPDTVPARLQALRNQYAAQLRAAEEERRRQQLARQQAENARRQYAADVDDSYRQQFSVLINNAVTELASIEASVTLDSFDQALATLKAYRQGYSPDELRATLRCLAVVPVSLNPDEVRQIQADTIARIAPSLSEQSFFEIGNTRDEIIDRMPSKRDQLIKAQKASHDEAQRIHDEIARRDAQAAADRQALAAQRQAQAQAAATAAAQQAQAEGLFALQAQPTYQPKTQVRLRLDITDRDQIPQVISAWWALEGANLPLDELIKTFRKQIAFVEARANDKTNPIKIDALSYREEVKAR